MAPRHWGSVSKSLLRKGAFLLQAKAGGHVSVIKDRTDLGIQQGRANVDVARPDHRDFATSRAASGSDKGEFECRLQAVPHNTSAGGSALKDCTQSGEAHVTPFWIARPSNKDIQHKGWNRQKEDQKQPFAASGDRRKGMTTNMMMHVHIRAISEKRNTYV
ncbi:hypothetical protein [Mesorhizobium sp.]|uniref:hypothetical protein n=1 Tax=Mesorhizobium sp. TaxID=1871066 RepID=UPI0025C2C03C|nr:hypothetical protein [Mesorhizobium sp.]